MSIVPQMCDGNALDRLAAGGRWACARSRHVRRAGQDVAIGRLILLTGDSVAAERPGDVRQVRYDWRYAENGRDAVSNACRDGCGDAHGSAAIAAAVGDERAG